MHEEKKWMLMTYYCPVHGDAAKIEPVEIPKGAIRKYSFKKINSDKKKNQ